MKIKSRGRSLISRSLLLLGIALVFTACGGGGGSSSDGGAASPPPIPNNWDQMSWDQGKWQ